MSFTPRNVSQLLVAKTNVSTAYNAATTAAAKKATLVNVGDYAIITNPFPVPSGASVTYTVNKSAGLIVKTATGFKVSEQLSIDALDSYTASQLAAGVNRKLTLTYPTGNAVPNVTYNATAILHDHIGSMLNERFIEAYVVTDANGTFTKKDGTLGAATLTAILAELASILQASFNQNGELYTVTSTATTLAVEQLPIAQRVGFVDGINNTFELTGKRIDSTINGGVYSAVIAPVTVTANGKINDLVQLKNLEWFISGYDKDPYRDSSPMTAFPADSNVGAAGIAIGDFIGIYQFHKDRDAVNVERQHRQLIVAGAGYAAINTALAATATTPA